MDSPESTRKPTSSEIRQARAELAAVQRAGRIERLAAAAPRSPRSSGRSWPRCSAADPAPAGGIWPGRLPNTRNVPLDDPRLQAAVLAHRGMADSLTWKFSRRVPGADMDELKAIAAEALCRAAARWVDPYCSSRGFDPWDEDDPSRPEKHFPGFAAKTISGALLDWSRHQDHLTRTDRHKVKAISAAQEGGARTEAELAAATGIPAEQVRAAQAAEAARPVSLDDTGSAVAGEYAGASIADDTGRGDVEGQAAVNEMLAGFLEVFDALPAQTQMVLAMRYHQESWTSPRWPRPCAWSWRRSRGCTMKACWPSMPRCWPRRRTRAPGRAGRPAAGCCGRAGPVG